MTLHRYNDGEDVHVLRIPSTSVAPLILNAATLLGKQ